MRIGITGFNTQSGLGVVNRQLCQHLQIYDWLPNPHKRFPTLPFPNDVVVADNEDAFLQQIDVLLFVENPLRINLPKKAKELGKRVVCVPMQEWMPGDTNQWDWPKYVDLFICPTQQCYNELRRDWPCTYVMWPVDVLNFQYRKREECLRYLYIHGHGGWHNRKGADIVCKAKQIWPEMPLIVYSQIDEDNWPPGTDVRGVTTYPQDLYAEGDVLLAPHKADGIGLELLEAMACGLPVIATDGQPWNELPLLAKIRATVGKQMIKREIDWYDPDPKHLVEVCRQFYQQDITRHSTTSRFYVVNRSWSTLQSTLLDAVTKWTT